MSRCTAIDRYLARTGTQLDIAFDADLGELTGGCHIVAGRIMFGHRIGVPAGMLPPGSAR